MKKNILITFILGTVFIYGLLVGKKEIFPYELIRYTKNIIVPNEINLEEKSPDYIKKIRLYKTYMNNNIPKIVMLGDSITNGCNWNELLKRSDMINRGIGGDTTYGIFQRLDTINPGSIKKAFIMAGINDISKYQNVQDIFYRYVKIISYMKQNNIQPYIQSTLFVGAKRKEFKEWNLKVSKLNTLLEKFSVENNIEYIDLNLKLSQDNLLLEEYHNGDGVHLSEKGYIVWKNILNKYL
ncbi:MAG: GDSL-type esterase/lipase family protein [Patescibacteria group bacterium]|nr:GDSL-type esterase/lipase family protein [Patescibacteria group bacterium]